MYRKGEGVMRRGEAVKNHKLLLTGVVLAALGALPAAVLAKIPEPDHVFYGQTTISGAPVQNAVVTVITGANASPVATFLMTPAAAGQYILRVPIDSVDPQAPGSARPGDEA